MALPLAQLVAELEAMAPLAFAEAWDNVGLLVDPRAHAAAPHEIHRALLTIDLTDGVLEEAEQLGAQVIVSYHPPIFQGLKRLGPQDPIARRLMSLVRRKIAVYSPHTALDAAPEGVNDWLAEAIGAGKRWPVQPADPPRTLKVVVFAPHQQVDALRAKLAAAGAGVIGNYGQCSFNLRGVGTFVGNEASHPVVGQAGQLERVEETRLEMVCPSERLRAVAEVIRREHPYEEPAWEAYPLQPTAETRIGQGRYVELDEPATLATVVERIKRHLSLRHVRVAATDGAAEHGGVRRAAVCAGAGGAVLERARNVELLLTGEMRHHDILARVASGCSVVLCDHTNTERGYLARLAERLSDRCGERLSIAVSQADRDPLEIL